MEHRSIHLICCLIAALVFSHMPIGHANPSKTVPNPAFEQKNQAEGPLAFSPGEQAYINSSPVIRVSNEFDWPPFDFVVAGKPAGFGIDLMALLAQRSGLSFEYVNGYTWDELTKMFFDGALDILHSMSITPERQKKALFSPPYYHSKHVLIFRSDTRDVNTLHDLEDRIIALPKGWSTIEFFEKHFPEVHIIEVDSTRQALEYIDQGKVIASVEQEGIARYFISKFGFSDLELSGWIDNDILQQTSSMHFAVLKTNPTLFSILDKALSSITSAEVEALKEKWISRAGRQIGGQDVGLTPEERHLLDKKKEISYCIAGERMPYSKVRANQVSGIMSDMEEIFSERLGVPFRMINANSFTDAIKSLEAGDCDIIPMISKTRARTKNLDFTSAFMSYNVAIISREDSPFIPGVSEVKDLRIGLVPTSNIFDKILTKYPKVNYIPVKTIEKALIKVSTGQLDAAAMSLPVATHYIRDTGLTNLKVAGHSSIKEDMRIGVLKENRFLHSIMSKAVRSLSHQELDLIYQKWVGSEVEHQQDYSLLWKSLSIAGTILVVIILWNRKLARLNREIALANLKLKDKTLELEHISTTDSLTGLFNRRYVENSFEMEIRRSARHSNDLSLVIIDIDHFKTINDTHGHQEGDEVLERFAGLVKSNIRGTDILGRWGGEEFIIICPQINIRNAVRMAQGLCQRIAAAHFGKTGRITASFGVTAYKKGDDSQAMVSRADQALYQAKSRGRNRVESMD